MPKDMRTEKHHQNDFAILGRTYGVSPTCCLWNATVIISNFGIMSSIFPKFNIIFPFSQKERLRSLRSAGSKGGFLPSFSS